MLLRFRKHLLALVALLVAAYGFYKFRQSISLKDFRWATAGASIAHARLWLWLVALAAIYVCYALRALRWMRFCSSLGNAHFSHVYPATLMGFTCIFLLGRPGEPIRPVLIARKDSLSIPQMFGVYVLERVFDMAAAATLAIFALLSFERSGPVGPAGDLVMTSARSAGIVLLGGLVAAVAFLIYFRYHGSRWLRARLGRPKWRHGWRAHVVALLEGFSEGLEGIRTWEDLGVASMYTAVHWVLVVLVYVWVIRAFPGALSALTASNVALVVAFTLVGSAAQLPVAGGGSQAATFLVLTLIFGIEKESAAVASIACWLIAFASCCLAGLPLLVREGWSMGELRRLARSEAKAEQAELLWEAERAAALQEKPR
ncbi:MAG TPA: lysylphosphatidylglycerol synthase transmembrane domain-containing protein [Candidatus Acidoferrum sp.]|nr:lysylphosphatidylglycerol synthase transmembrane domain-containing protein [Candidatus Acidoferrum sp.]